MHNHPRLRILLPVLVLLAHPAAPAAADAPAAPPAAAGPSKHVLIIGIDGVRSDALQAAGTPNLDALIAAGAVSYDAFAGGVLGTVSQAQSSSGPGWTSILTGVWADKHGVKDNSFKGRNFENYPHFYQRIREANPTATLASIVQWEPIDSLIVAPASTDYRATGQAVADKAVAYLAANDPVVLFLHFDDVDHAGHHSGFSTTNTEYLAAISQADQDVGKVLAAIHERPKHADEEWLVLVTTDHGGIQKGHGGQSAVERTVFMIASGGGVTHRVISPGPGLTAIAPTVLTYLGIPINPAWGWESLPFGL